LIHYIKKIDRKQGKLQGTPNILGKFAAKYILNKNKRNI